MSIAQRIFKLKRSKRFAAPFVFVLATALGLGIALLGILPAALGCDLPRFGEACSSRPAVVTPTASQPTTGKGNITVSARPSQWKFVQGDQGLLYVDVSIQSQMRTGGFGARESDQPRAAVDLVVVLDRSGSMAAENKLPFAKQAIENLLAQLNSADRFALVTFDNYATVNAPLVSVTDSERARLRSLVQEMRPGGSTNIEDGLVRARELLRNAPVNVVAGRNRRVILLSDGEANVGIVDHAQLGHLAKEFQQYSGVLSTIGMGLGFNESLMSSLADYGMGNYSYLEHLASLGEILQKDLNDTRALLAWSSELRLDTPCGVEVVDASGYPIESDLAERATYRSRTSCARRIPTGQILGNGEKRLMLTLRLPTTVVGAVAVGSLSFDTWDSTGKTVHRVSGMEQQFAVVAPENRAEAMATVDGRVYQQSWTANNIGRLNRSVGDYLRKGDRYGALNEIGKYRADLKGAEASSDMALGGAEVESKLGALEALVADSFTGGKDEQAYKQNSRAKSLHLEGRKAQRDSR